MGGSGCQSRFAERFAAALRRTTASSSIREMACSASAPLPLTAIGAVDVVITDLAVFDFAGFFILMGSASPFRNGSTLFVLPPGSTPYHHSAVLGRAGAIFFALQPPTT